MMNLRTSGLVCLLLLAVGCGGKSTEKKSGPRAPLSEDKKAESQPATPKAASTTGASSVASTSPSMTAAQRIEAWKKKQPNGWKILGEQAVGPFIYAVAINPADKQETSQILATDRGEVEPPITLDRTSTEDPDPQLATLSEIGDMDGDGQVELVVTYSLGGGDGGMVLYLNKPQGPTSGTEIGGPSNVSPTNYNGKPAIAIEIIDTGGDENGDFHNSNEIIFWNGKDFERVDAPKK
jgi:hypothetical protein